MIILTTSGCISSHASVSVDEKKYDSDNATIEIQIPKFKNLSNEEFQNSINNEYESIINSRLDEFNKSIPENPPEKCRFSLLQEVKLKSSRVISILGEAYIFTEGIHGISERIPKNVDIVDNKILTLADLFLDEEYPTAINREIDAIVNSNPDEYHDLWEKPILSSMHEEYFYLTKDGLVIFYPPYELSYYARGFVEFLIPYEKLTGYIKPQYKPI